MILTSSVAGMKGMQNNAHYVTAKHGLTGLMRSACLELAPHQIRVNTIAPGIMETPMLGRLRADILDNLAASVPHPKRLGRPTDFGRLALELLGNPYLNGENIRLDGALRFPPK